VVRFHYYYIYIIFNNKKKIIIIIIKNNNLYIYYIIYNYLDKDSSSIASLTSGGLFFEVNVLNALSKINSIFIT